MASVCEGCWSRADRERVRRSAHCVRGKFRAYQRLRLCLLRFPFVTTVSPLTNSASPPIASAFTGERSNFDCQSSHRSKPYYSRQSRSAGPSRSDLGL